MKLSAIGRALGCEVRGDGDVEIADVAPLEDAGPGMLTFLADRRYASQLAGTRAAAVIVPLDEPDVALPSLRAPQPYVAFVGATALLHPPPRPVPGIHPTAVVAPSATLGAGAAIGPHAVIGERVRVGRDAVLHPHVVLYADVEIGDGFTAHAGAVVHEGVRIGDRVTLHAGAVIGSDGFGYLPLPDGNRKIPQIGTVVLEDDVDIGANTTVDRAALGTTVIGRGTKIDNQVMVAHNCRIGPHCLIAAQSGFAGSTIIGARVLVGGQVGASGHLTIGDAAQLAAQTGIHADVPAGAVLSGSPALDARLWRRVHAALPRLPDLLRRLRRLEKTLGIASGDPGKE